METQAEITNDCHRCPLEDMIKWIENELPEAWWSISSSKDENFDLEITFPNHWDECNESKFFTDKSIFELFTQAVKWINDESAA